MRRLAPIIAVALVAATASVGVASALDTPPPTPVPVPCQQVDHHHRGGKAKASPSPSPEATSQPGVCVSPSPFPTVLHTPAPSKGPPRTAPAIRARAAILEDLDTGQVLFARHANDERPLASTTKIMTALVVLSRAHPGEVITVGPDAAEEGSAGAGFSELGLASGEHITVQNLLYAMMLQSSNDASVALAEGLSGTTERFVAAMNRMAHALGLHHSKFFSPSGLDDRGHSSARELAAITRRAFRDALFARIVRTEFFSIPAPSGPPRRVQNRNVLLWLYPGSLGGKTGYTSAAGFCLVAAAEREGRRLLSVVLGDATGDDTFDDSAALLNFGFRGFRPVTLARRGQALPPVPVGTDSLTVRADADLSSLVPVGKAPKVKRAVRVRPGLELPLRAGTKVGVVAFLLGGRRLGRVAMVVPVSARVAPRPGAGARSAAPSGSPWWERGAGAVVTFGMRAFWSLFG